MRAVRPGEAKLCVRVRRASLTLGLGVAASARLQAVWRAIVAAIRMGFHWHIVKTRARRSCRTCKLIQFMQIVASYGLASPSLSALKQGFQEVWVRIC